MNPPTDQTVCSEPLNCPSCRRPLVAGDASLSAQNATCSRCNCEIEPLLEIRRAADAYLDAAKQALDHQNAYTAEHYADAAWTLYHHRQIAAYGLLASVLLGEPLKISRWTRRQS